MIQNKINTLFSLFLTDFFKKFGILETIKEDELIQFLYDNFKLLNSLLDDDYIFYYEDMPSNKAKKSLKQLDKLYKFLSFPVNEFFTEFEDMKETDLYTEYKNILQHFNTEHAILKFATEKKENRKTYTANEAIEFLNELA